MKLTLQPSRVVQLRERKNTIYGATNQNKSANAQIRLGPDVIERVKNPRTPRYKTDRVNRFIKKDLKQQSADTENHTTSAVRFSDEKRATAKVRRGASETRFRLRSRRAAVRRKNRNEAETHVLRTRSSVLWTNDDDKTSARKSGKRRLYAFWQMPNHTRGA